MAKKNKRKSYIGIYSTSVYGSDEECTDVEELRYRLKNSRALVEALRADITLLRGILIQAMNR